MYLLIVTGLSGAGKSLALRCLEEQGYFCVDNLPSSMLSEFVRLCEAAQPSIQKAAVTIDSRESLLSRSAEVMTSSIDTLSVPHELLFLDARDDVLRKRYNEVRRRHPLGDAGDAITGVKRERKYLQAMRDRANYILDTSDIAPRDFPNVIAHVLPAYESRHMSILVCSFGYKRGVPVDADMVLDMRFIPNPFYVESLRAQSGLDPEVRDYVFAQPYANTFMDRTEEILKETLPLFDAQDKHMFRICFGCTGGRHRSVAAAEEMAARLLADGRDVRIFHRDLVIEASDIRARFRDGD